MLIRITQNSKGVEDYFETGIKKGRERMRDDFDRRVHLSGDLDKFALTAQYTRKNKPNWKDHYWHISASFALENNDLTDETLRAINKDLIAYYFCDYDVNNLVHAAEAHRPKVQSQINKSSGEIHQRYLHFHNAISKYDVLTGNQLRMIPFNQDADRAFQSHICQKYGLIDPVTKLRNIPLSRKAILDRWKANSDTPKQTKVADLRKLFSQLVNDVQDLDQAKEILLDLDMVSRVVFKDNKKSGNKYLQVKTSEDTRNINLRGKGFERLEALYYNEKERDLRKIKKIDNDYEAIFKAHQAWWISEQEKRLPKEKKNINYDHMNSKYINNYEKFTKEQRKYFVIYKTNIQKESICGYQIFEKVNERYLVNNELNVKIIDRPDKIVLEIPDDPYIRQEAVKLALSIAVSKGWNLNEMEITGSFDFIEEVKRQISEINKKTVPVPDAITKPRLEKKTYKARLNTVNQAINDAKDIQINRLSKEEIAELKVNLGALDVINYARKHFGLQGDYFTITADNKINDKRTKAKPKNVVDFLTKTCNVSIREALPLLQTLYENQKTLKNEEVKQRKKERENIKTSIFILQNYNNFGVWQQKEPRTFTDLAILIKSHSYAGFIEQTNNERKFLKIGQRSKCAIFDIDNDSDKPGLSVAGAQALLKNTTFMLITTKSHQLEIVNAKGDTLPAVDRYRLIIPITHEFSINEDEYGLAMVKLAEQLGISNYVDKKSLGDAQRQYSKSPSDAQFIINNTNIVFDTTLTNEFASEELRKVMWGYAAEAEAREIEERNNFKSESIKAPEQKSDNNVLDTDLDDENDWDFPDL